MSRKQHPKRRANALLTAVGKMTPTQFSTFIETSIVPEDMKSGMLNYWMIEHQKNLMASGVLPPDHVPSLPPIVKGVPNAS